MKSLHLVALSKKIDFNKIKSIKRISKATNGIADVTQKVQKSVVNPAYYQAFNGIQVTSDIQKAIDQSLFFLENNYVPSTQKILNGFKDGGSYAKILDDGSVVDSAREIIVVDRNKDEKLVSIIKDFGEKIKDLNTDEEMKSDFVQRYVYEKFAKKSLGVPSIEYQAGEEKYLGDILENGTPVCRHLALLYKILGDDVNLETDLVRGRATFNRATGRHAWVRVQEDGCVGICDPTNGIATGYLEDVVDSAFGRLYCKYEMPDGLPFD